MAAQAPLWHRSPQQVPGRGRPGTRGFRGGPARVQFRNAPAAYDPFVGADYARRLGAELLPLDELLAQSDFVTLHTPLTPSTTNLIGAREVALMKPDARLINVARGELLDEEALLQALEEGHPGRRGPGRIYPGTAPESGPGKSPPGDGDSSPGGRPTQEASGRWPSRRQSRFWQCWKDGLPATRSTPPLWRPTLTNCCRLHPRGNAAGQAADPPGPEPVRRR